MRKQLELVRDSEQMVPDTRRRLEAAAADLDACIDGVGEAARAAPEYAAALEQRTSARAALWR